MLSNAYKNFVAKKRATLRKLLVLQREQNLKDDLTSDEGQLMDYCIQRATVLVQQTCSELLYIVRDTILPMYATEESYDGKADSLKVAE